MTPMIIAWEVTRRCGLHCRHCRAAADDRSYHAEFSTEECFRTIDAIARLSKPMLILTGGEPLQRDDVYEIARYATEKGLRVVMATCGHLLDEAVVEKLKNSGVVAISISLDAATAEAHDAFRGVAGSYTKTLEGVSIWKAAGLPFQVNTTVSRLNAVELPQILANAIALGASAMDFFFLVPTGRGAEIADYALSADARDQALAWIAGQEREAPIRVRVTCAPQYKQFRLPVAPGEPLIPFRGCMGGRGFVFITNTGVLQPCGFLDVSGGDLRSHGFDFAQLYHSSPVFQKMRSLDPFGECPARSYARSGSL
jgi:AdoMet-dependent heme synthase